MTIRTGENVKFAYLSCPSCKKKVLDLETSNCLSCQKYYEKGQYRYILRVKLTDESETIWANCYDDVGEVLLALENEEKFSADACMELSEDIL